MKTLVSILAIFFLLFALGCATPKPIGPSFFNAIPPANWPDPDELYPTAEIISRFTVDNYTEWQPMDKHGKPGKIAYGFKTVIDEWIYRSITIPDEGLVVHRVMETSNGEWGDVYFIYLDKSKPIKQYRIMFDGWIAHIADQDEINYSARNFLVEWWKTIQEKRGEGNEPV